MHSLEERTREILYNAKEIVAASDDHPNVQELKQELLSFALSIESHRMEISLDGMQRPSFNNLVKDVQSFLRRLKSARVRKRARLYRDELPALVRRLNRLKDPKGLRTTQIEILESVKECIKTMQGTDHPTAGVPELHQALEAFVASLDQYFVVCSDERVDEDVIRFINQVRHFVRLLGEGNTYEWQFHLEAYQGTLHKILARLARAAESTNVTGGRDTIPGFFEPPPTPKPRKAKLPLTASRSNDLPGDKFW